MNNVQRSAFQENWLALCRPLVNIKVLKNPCLEKKIVLERQFPIFSHIAEDSMDFNRYKCYQIEEFFILVPIWLKTNEKIEKIEKIRLKKDIFFRWIFGSLTKNWEWPLRAFQFDQSNVFYEVWKNSYQAYQRSF